MRGPMKMIDSHNSQMECRVCGSTHRASIKPHSNGQLYRGSFQCSNEHCPSNNKVWRGGRFVKPDWRPMQRMQHAS